MTPETLLRVAPLLAIAALVGCAEPEGPRDVAREFGVDFVHDNGFRGSYAFPETMGSGVALLDLGGDGDLDVYALQAGPVPGTPAYEAEKENLPANRLFENVAAGEFEDVTERSGDAAHRGCAMGACVGDVNGDGFDDVFVTCFGPDALLVDRGDGSFEDRAAGTDLADADWNTACGFADLDRDGHLDLVVVGYVASTIELLQGCTSNGSTDYCDVAQYEGEGDSVWRGDGSGAFEDRTGAWGLGQSRGMGLGLALVDFDDDGDADLYLANDSVENRLFANDGTGMLVDVTTGSGAAYNQDGETEAGMGVAVGDVVGDALPDILVTNFSGESNALYENSGGQRFRDRSRASGLAAHSRRPLGFGTTFCDLDRDGRLDLFVTNGHVMRHAGEARGEPFWAQPDQLFRGLAGGTFEAWDAGDALTVPRVGRGVAAGDLDGDGRCELVLTGSGEPLRILSGFESAPGSSALAVRLLGNGSNTRAVGARVQLVLVDGTSQTRWVRSGTGYLSQDALHPLFAIPAGADPVEVRVRWPDGSTSVHAVKGPTREIELRQKAP